MPINISTVPRKRITKSKKQEDAARVYKNNGSGPDPNAPQPPSPDSDATDDADETTAATASKTTSRTTTANTTATAANTTATTATANTPTATAANTTTANTTTATATATTATTTAAANTDPSSVQKGKKSQKVQKDDSYDRLEVNRLLSDLFPSTYMTEKLKQLEKNPKAKAKSASKSNEP